MPRRKSRRFANKIRLHSLPHWKQRKQRVCHADFVEVGHFEPSGLRFLNAFPAVSVGKTRSRVAQRSIKRTSGTRQLYFTADTAHNSELTDTTRQRHSGVFAPNDSRTKHNRPCPKKNGMTSRKTGTAPSCASRLGQSLLPQNFRSEYHIAKTIHTIMLRNQGLFGSQSLFYQPVCHFKKCRCDFRRGLDA